MHKGDRYRPPRAGSVVSKQSQMDGCYTGEKKASLKPHHANL